MWCLYKEAAVKQYGAIKDWNTSLITDMRYGIWGLGIARMFCCGVPVILSGTHHFCVWYVIVCVCSAGFDLRDTAALCGALPRVTHHTGLLSAPNISHWTVCFSGPVGDPPATHSYLFRTCKCKYTFNEPLGWDTSKVTNMEYVPSCEVWWGGVC